MVTARCYARTSSESRVKIVAKFAMFMVALVLKSHWLNVKTTEWTPKTRPLRKRRPF